MIGTYGHGTENDFVLIFDPENKVEVSADQVRAICSRKTGIGSDGFIRIGSENSKWFMDYRNNDGSIAEMCGNGIRVMAKYLIERGHQKAGIFPIDTRDGVKFLSAPDTGDITVNMGQIREVFGEISARTNGHTWTGYNIDMGNPHAVVFVESISQVGDLVQPPVVEPADEYPEGVNVEFVEFLENGELKMRVHERGVGETKSCGTGTCAVALAATLKKGMRLPATWIINPPGGRLSVEIDAHNNAILTGPAILVEDRDLSKYL
jgi:diaminopimelate epimerase